MGVKEATLGQNKINTEHGHPGQEDDRPNVESHVVDGGGEEAVRLLRELHHRLVLADRPRRF
jgi:hypothetical protein